MQLPGSKLKKAVMAALFLSVPLSTFHVYASWLATSAHGTNALNQISTMAIGVLGLTIIATFVGLVVGLVRLIFRLKQADATQVGALAAFCGTGIVIMMIALGIAGNFRNKALQSIRTRAGPLIVAIEQFQVKNRALPDGLDELVPDYLPAIPDTGVGASPQFTYLPKPDPGKYDGNPWVLFVNVSTGDLMQDLMIYYPDQNYPTNPIGRNVRKIADWAIIGTPRHSSDNH